MASRTSRWRVREAQSWMSLMHDYATSSKFTKFCLFYANYSRHFVGLMQFFRWYSFIVAALGMLSWEITTLHFENKGCSFSKTQRKSSRYPSFSFESRGGREWACLWSDANLKWKWKEKKIGEFAQRVHVFEKIFPSPDEFLSNMCVHWCSDIPFFSSSNAVRKCYFLPDKYFRVHVSAVFCTTS